MNALQFINEMDRLAQVHFAEFGYDTCDQHDKQAVIKLLLDLIANTNKKI